MDQRDTDTILNARFDAATAAGNVAAVAAQISRALSWEATPERLPAFISQLEAAIKAASAVERQLHEIIGALQTVKRT